MRKRQPGFFNPIIPILCLSVLALLVGCNDSPHVHDYQPVPEMCVEATCVADGHVYYLCACGDTKIIDVPKTGVHVPGSEVEENIVPATCTQDGSYDAVVYCETCHLELSREQRAIRSTGHVFDLCVESPAYLKSEATCTAPKTYYKSCTCGLKGTETFTAGSALGHSFTNYVSDNNATHFADGTKTAHCDNDCGTIDIITEQGTKIAHSFNLQVKTDEYLVSSATCTEAAKYYYSCECGVKGTEIFTSGEPLGHLFTDYVYDNDATHLLDGHETAECQREGCDATDTRIASGTRLLDHAYVRQIAQEQYLCSPATCTEAALYYKSCACGEKGTETFEYGEPLGHNLIHHTGLAATCTAAGWEEYDTCSRCDYTTYRTIPMTGHDIIHHAGQAPTCTEEGWEEYDTCSRCDYTTYQSIPIHHEYVLELASEEHLKENLVCQGKIVYYKSCECGANGTETFEVTTAAGYHADDDGTCPYCGRDNSIAEYGIETAPTKVDYIYGDTFSPAGIVLMIKPDVGEDIYVSSGFTFPETPLTETGNQTVEIRYVYNDTELVFLQPITVVARTPVSMEIVTPQTKDTYFTYESFDSTGLTLRVTYNNGTTKQISAGYSVSEPEHNTDGDFNVTLSYTENGETVSCDSVIHVLSVVPAQLQIYTPATKVEYTVFEDFDPTGLVLEVLNNDGTRFAVVSTGFTCALITEVGDAVSETITYVAEGVTLNAYQTIKVNPRTPVSLTVSKQPDKVSYVHGETFDPDGVELTVGYNFGPQQVITTGYTTNRTGAFMNETGSVEVTFSYQENGATVNCRQSVSVAHSFTRQVTTEEYLCSGATCLQAATYYYSCECTACGTESFAYGSALGHTGYAEDHICDRCSQVIYEIGDTGPAGGLVFYDKGEVSDGWRYLEAAPSDIGGGVEEYIFGYYRFYDDDNNLFVNGSVTYNAENCTLTAVGTGKRNTQLLVGAMGESAYAESDGSSRTSVYAAKLCDDYECGGYSDWFLPSKDELNLMYTNLKSEGLGGFSDERYLSSSEGMTDASIAIAVWIQFFDNGMQSDGGMRNSGCRVRAIRAF